MTDLIKEQETYEEQLREARKQVASVQKKFGKQEKLVKAKEKEVADKVGCPRSYLECFP